jgi:type II secretory pathway pseudopilin PulG
MKSALPYVLAALALSSGTFAFTAPVAAQSANLQQKVAEAKQLMLVNRQQLSRYTWQLQETVSVNGDVKEVSVYQVQLGPDGQQVRTLVSQPVAPQTSDRQHGLRHRMTDDFKQYAGQVAALAKSYAQPDPGKLQQLAAQGAVSLRSGGAPGYAPIVISNWVKQGDSVILTLSENPKALYAVNVNSYLSGPSDVVTVQVRYATLPDGTHYAATTTVNGQSKNLTVTDQSSNFTLRPQ